MAHRGQDAPGYNARVTVEQHLRAAREHKDAGRFAQAALEYVEALRQEPHRKSAYLDLAYCLQVQNRYADAANVCLSALKIDSNFVEALGNLGNLSHYMDKPDDAIGYLERAIAIEPTFAQLQNSLGTVYKEIGRLDQAIRCYETAQSLRPSAGVASNLLYARLFAAPENARELFEAHASWSRQFAPPGLRRFDHSRHSRGQRLRVGYVSPNFKSHAVNFFVEPIILHHDRSTTELFLYSDVPGRGDAITEKLRNASEHWRDTSAMSDDQLAEAVHSDRVDVLVDLTGHIAGARLLAFARRPAPVQVTYIGYQFTTGLAEMDFRLTDEIADPPGQTDEFYSEKLWRLPDCFFCYRPPSASYDVGPLPADSNGFVTFGCQNNFAKICARTFVVWTELLNAVPDSKLAILIPMSQWSMRNTTDALQTAGIDPSRLIVLRRSNRRDYLNRYNQIDIALDPIPFNGHTTTCDAMWMGVPVVTRLGTQYVSRYGSSAVINAGFSQMVAQDDADYVRIAAKLATDGTQLRELRSTLRSKFTCSIVCNHAGFVRRLEEAYAQMWDQRMGNARTSIAG
ncbi:MAG: tetratricopeptide repeat protein [Tepidisphaeraceae bacterium]